METPNDVKSPQTLLRFLNYLSKFLSLLSDICEPLSWLTDKDVDWAWLQKNDAALEKNLNSKI